MVQLQSEAIDFQAVTDAVRSPSAGAVCLFLGTVREMTGGQRTRALTYEAHATLAGQMLHEVEAETRDRWPVTHIQLVHRTGYLAVGEISVAVAVSSPHRKDAFAACQYAMDRIKEIVPIWKQDHNEAGTSQWIHPLEGTPQP
ncbi:MAG TPA: molybdenum cofactor biosynthesis protein MoaE [Gemmatales bacterium]|nr:molybdenum cofactor biosynthesis protein MoaE [Gemmatales bacterium]